MTRRTSLYTVLVLLLVLGGVGTGLETAHAQNNRFTERSFVASPVALGMGDTGVALPGIEQSFFYNPAHLPAVPSHFTIFGLQGAASQTLDDHIHFYNRRVAPAVESDFDLSTEELSTLVRDAAALGRRPSRGHGAVLLPSFVYAPGALAVGGGLYAKTALNYRVEEGDAGIPSVWTRSRTDLMALASLGLDLRVVGLSGVSVGLTGTQTRRTMAYKNEPLGRFEKQEVSIPMEGTTFQLDAGITYTPTWLDTETGTLRIGGAVYDVLYEGYDYAIGGNGRVPFLDDTVGQPDADSVDVTESQIERARGLFSLRTSYRVGIAYERAKLFFLDDVAVALDVQGYQKGNQTPLARTHVGVRANVVGPLEIRGGMGSGYPAGGLGLELGAFHFDYAFYGVEEGRRAGQLSTYLHTVRLLVRLQ